MTTLLEALQPYLDPLTGCVRASDRGTDNEQLFTAIALQIEYSEFLSFYLTRLLKNTEVTNQPGLFARYFKAIDNSVDNYIGIVSFKSKSSFAKNYSKSIPDYGSNHWWSFSVSNPGHFTIKDCYLRFIGFRPYVLMMNGDKISFFSQALYSIAMLATIVTKSTDVGNIQLQWLMNRGVRGKYKLIDAAILAWGYLCSKRWPGGMCQIFSIYHGSNHPFVTFGSKDFN